MPIQHSSYPIHSIRCPHRLLTPTTTTTSTTHLSPPIQICPTTTITTTTTTIMSTTDHPSSPPPPLPNPNLDGILTLALPAPEAPNSTAVPTPSPPQPSIATTSIRRFPAPCWTHEETLALIDSYREKWFSLNRGNLRAPHWQEVADDLSQRCQHLLNSDPPATTSKTAVQCRHKVEKLRKRYRAERQRSLRLDPNSSPQSAWVYFRKFDDMDLSGSSAATASSSKKPALGAKRSPPSSSEEDSSSEESDDDEEENPIANGRGSGRGRGPPPPSFTFKIPKMDRRNEGIPLNYTNGKRFFGYNNPEFEEMKRAVEGKRRREEAEEKMTSGSSVMGEIATAVRTLGDGFMRMERLKMDMSREFEKVRMEMELRRTEMILDSHRRMIDAFVTGLIGHNNNNNRKKKKAKISTLS